MAGIELMRVESLSITTDGAVVVARRSQVGNFSLSARSLLSGVALKSLLKIPPMKAGDIPQGFDVFALHLQQPEDLHNFSIGEEVLFENPE